MKNHCNTKKYINKLFIKYTPVHFTLFVTIVIIGGTYINPQPYYYFIIGIITTLYFKELWPKWVYSFIENKTTKPFQIKIVEETE